jgi:membrane protease YdiL (CAAX protease family)
VWLRVLLTVAVLFLAPWAGALLSLVPGYDRAAEGPNLPLSLALIGCAFALALGAYLLGSVLLVRGVDRRPGRALGLHIDRGAAVGFLAGIGISVAVVLVVQGAASALGTGRHIDAEQVEQALALPLWFDAVYLVLLAFVLQGIGEEVLFRGYLLQSLSNRPRLAVLVSATAFALMHLTSRGGQQGALEHVVYLALPFGFALAAGVLAIALCTVWAAIGIHGGFHLVSQTAAGFGMTADGPMVWLLHGAAFALIAAIVGSRIRATRWDEVAAHGPYARRAAEATRG